MKLKVTISANSEQNKYNWNMVIKLAKVIHSKCS